MTTIILGIPDELAQQLDQVRDRLPELLVRWLYQPVVPAYVYRHILTVLASNPTPQQIADFRPTEEMQQRLQTLLERNHAGVLTPAERAELTSISRSSTWL